MSISQATQEEDEDEEDEESTEQREMPRASSRASQWLEKRVTTYFGAGNFLGGTSGPMLNSDRQQTNSALRQNGMRLATESSWVINPEQSILLERWDRMVLLALAYVAILSPVQIAMLESDFNILFWVNMVVDVVLFVDMIIQFFVMYPKKTSYGLVMEHRLPVIARHYFRTWFPVDFLSVAPVDLVSILLNSSGMGYIKLVKVLRLVRLMKLIRVVRASRLIRRYEARMSITYKQLALLRFFVMICMIIHWMANLWALTLTLADEGSPRWVDTFDHMEKHLEPDDMTKNRPWKLYIASVYFTSYTLTSVGYGDIGPMNILERIVCTVMLVISGTAWAVVLGQVCGIVANMDADELAFRTVMDELNFMMRDRVFPQTMRQRLRTFFLSNKAAQRRKRYQHILRSMSPGLRGEVAVHFNRVWVTKISFLKQMMLEPEESRFGRLFYTFIVDVSQAMEFDAHAQGEAFGAPQVLYILNRGLVSRPPRLHVQGAVWGVDFVLSDTELCQFQECHCLTYVEITFLTRATFVEIVAKHKAICPELSNKVRWFCSWLAFQRAIWLEVKRRKATMQQTGQHGVMWRDSSMARQCDAYHRLQSENTSDSNFSRSKGDDAENMQLRVLSRELAICDRPNVAV